MTTAINGVYATYASNCARSASEPLTIVVAVSTARAGAAYQRRPSAPPRAGLGGAQAGRPHVRAPPALHTPPCPGTGDWATAHCIG